MPEPEATIVMRARDEIRWVAATLEAVFRQRDRSFELVFVDSGSTDGTLEVASRFPVRLLQITPEDFSYSHALNVGAAVGSSRFVVCLNADAEPLDELWLTELLRPLREDPRVAATYSRQEPRPGSHATVRRDYSWAFGELAPRVEPPFVSMVSSAYRRILWERHPFWSSSGAGDEVEWVRWARAAGWNVAYAPRSRVAHSHNYTGVEHYRKQRREQRVQVELFGRRASWSPPAALARLPLEWVRDALFLARGGEWVALPSAAVARAMQAAGRIHGWFEARAPRGGTG